MRPDLISLLQNETMIRDAAFKALPPIAHVKLISEFQAAIPTMDDAKRLHLAERLSNAITEENGGLGALEGYSGLESTLPPNWLPSEIEYFSSRVESLQTALLCAERPLNTDVAKLECLTSLRRQWPRLERASRRTESAESAAKAAKAMLEADRVHRWNMGKRELDVFFGNASWALYGLAARGARI